MQIVEYRLQLSLIRRGFIQDVSRRSTERRKPLHAGRMNHMIKTMLANSRAVLLRGAGAFVEAWRKCLSLVLTQITSQWLLVLVFWDQCAKQKERIFVS